MLDFIYLSISHKLFKGCYWFGLYRDETEDITPNMSEARLHEVSISQFVDVGISGVKYIKFIHMGVFIFINKASI